ncbi:MAG: bifunctional folylpolyglutamate synthase/dihydrofolate synthase [Gammaproteobacteria bacterium]|nr:bifunctional folylpolyglutamate synthase/dihydrofolate synthase [Gammaproteobacteria bacterium]
MEVALKPSNESSLDRWLEYISKINPREIDLGLSRILTVYKNFEVARLAPLVITVAGTNGKGSTVAAIEGMLSAQGIRVSAFTSPHIDRFNERFRINEVEVEDHELCSVFSEIEVMRKETPLSYFEFTALAGFLIFARAELDVVILEVGLGGRLDAVNIIDADICVVTNISIDHEGWLGEGREAIAAEKAGILRSGAQAIFGDRNLPNSLIRKAEELELAPLCLGQDFGWERTGEVWDWYGLTKIHNMPERTQTISGLPVPKLLLDNVAVAMQVLYKASIALGFPINFDAQRNKIGTLQLSGRQEWRRDKATKIPVLLDVAHNQGAAEILSNELRVITQLGHSVIVVLAIMADKRVAEFLRALGSGVSEWHIGEVDADRCLSVSSLEESAKELFTEPSIYTYDSLKHAYLGACEKANSSSVVVVTGSFLTVSAVRNLSVSSVGLV